MIGGKKRKSNERVECEIKKKTRKGNRDKVQKQNRQICPLQS